MSEKAEKKDCQEKPKIKVPIFVIEALVLHMKRYEREAEAAKRRAEQIKKYIDGLEAEDEEKTGEKAM